MIRKGKERWREARKFKKWREICKRWIKGT